MIIRSYRRVFRVDRRVYSIPRGGNRPPIPLPLPGGVQVRGITYAAGAFIAVLVCSAVPLLRDLFGLLPSAIRYVILPVGVAMLGLHSSPDGRPAHRAAEDWLKFELGAKRTTAGRRALPDVVLFGGVLPTAWDASSTELKGGRVDGHARVTFTAPVVVREREGKPLVVRPGEGQHDVVYSDHGLVMRP